jgi:acyl carrier protein
MSANENPQLGPAESVRTRVCELVAELTPSRDAAVQPSDRLSEDLGLDSIRLIELAVGLEEEFALRRIDDERAMAVITVADLIGIVEDLSGDEGHLA